MPLTIDNMHCRSYYIRHLESDVITDCIVEGRKKYPVIDLVSNYLYDSAFELLQKGYKCLHGDSLHAAREISLFLDNFAKPKDISRIHGKENLPDIEQMLYAEIDEHMKSSPSEYSTFITQIGRGMAEMKDGQAIRHMIPYIREHAPAFYSVLVSRGDFDLSTLLRFDNGFVEDYVKRLEKENKSSQFISDNQIDEGCATSMLLDVFDYMDLDTFNTLQTNLFTISQAYPDIFPTHFTCDVVILFMIGRFRFVDDTSGRLRNLFVEDDDLILDAYDDETRELLRSYVNRYFTLLHFHMKPNYTLDRVALVLISCIGPFSRNSTPTDTDLALLDAATLHAKKRFGIEKLPISEFMLTAALNQLRHWLLIYAAENLPGLYDGNELLATYLPKAEKIANWFHENCDVTTRT